MAAAVTMASLAKPVPPDPPTSKVVQERLEHWREVLLQVKAGADTRTTLATVRVALDRWLDERVDQRGSARLADVWDREWPATWTVDRMSDSKVRSR